MMNKKDKKVTGNFEKTCKKIVLGLLGLCLCFGAIGIGLTVCLKDFDQSFKDNVVTIYAALASSFLALFGVLLTIIAGKGNEIENRKFSHTPELFMPSKYDLAKAVHYRLNSNDSSNIIIPNYKVYIQNTSKTEFVIEEISASECDDKVLIKDSSPHYVDKGLLFCISFYSEERIHKMLIKTKSLDNYEYLFEIDLEKKTIKKEE